MKTNGILDLFDRDFVLAYLEDSSRVASPASLFIILAIGAQCRGSSSANHSEVSTAYFAKGRALAFHGMLCDPHLEMIHNFLLMAYYLLGACHRNGAFMYLGVASKAATALGLQKADHYSDLPLEASFAR